MTATSPKRLSSRAPFTYVADFYLINSNNSYEYIDNCFDIARVTLSVSATNPLNVLALLEECDQDDLNDGKFSFDLNGLMDICLNAKGKLDIMLLHSSSFHESKMVSLEEAD